MSSADASVPADDIVAPAATRKLKRENVITKTLSGVLNPKSKKSWYHQPTDRDFVKDDRVYIANKVTLKGRFRNDGDRKATVSKVTQSSEGKKCIFKRTTAQGLGG